MVAGEIVQKIRMAPSALHDSVPDIDHSVRMAVEPIGTPRKSGSTPTSFTNGNTSANNEYGAVGHGPTSNGVADHNGTLATAEQDFNSFWRRYEALKLHDNQKYLLLEDVLTRYESLQQKHREYVNATEQHLLARASNQESAYREYAEKLHGMLHREAFMLVLIDGDGMIFNDHLLRLGENGGKKAADMLEKAVDEWARAHLAECPPTFKIITRIYANVKGLAETCRRAGIVSSPEIIENFVRGFTNQNDFFDFIDVGPGKDRADVKMKAQFETFIYNWQCRHILFGCSHDNGFARLLDKYALDAESVSRVTLMEGVPFEKELEQLPFSKNRFNGLFREHKIFINPATPMIDIPRLRHDSKATFNPTSGVFTPSHEIPSFIPQSGHETPSPAISACGGLTRTNSFASTSPVPDTPAPSNRNVGNGGAGGWASVARGSAHLPLKDIARPTSGLKVTGPTIRRNKAGQRLDAPMDYNHERVSEMKKMKYCNQHYIGRGCCHFDSHSGACPHNHDADLTKDDLKWLRVVARETVCKKGSGCADFECIYGHACPYPKADNSYCINRETCRFPREMHNVDTVTARVIHPHG